ncbi:TPA: hypothetical protein KOR75_001085 [Clostridioides difficile]|nr:hypothetical protein [Clostridioides difficile]
MNDEKLIKDISEVIEDSRIVNKSVLVAEFNKKPDIFLLNKIMDVEVDTYYIVTAIMSKYVSEIVKDKFIYNSLSNEYEYVLKRALKAAVKEYECKKKIATTSVFNIYYHANGLLVCSSFDNMSINAINNGADEVYQFAKEELIKYADKLALDILGYYTGTNGSSVVKFNSSSDRLNKLAEKFGFTLAMFIYIDAGKFERKEITLEKFTRVIRECCYRCYYLDKETIEMYIYGDEN